MNKIIKKILFAFAALSFLAFAALPASAQVSQASSCTLVKDVAVNIVVSGDDNDVVKIYANSLVSERVDPTQGTAPAAEEMNGDSGDNSNNTGNITVQIRNNDNTLVDAGKGSATLDIPVTSLSAIASNWGIVCLMNTINTIVNWVSILVLLFSTVLIIYAGFLWMTSGQNPENQEKAGKFIMAALVGFGIVILARVLPAIISGILL